MGRCKGYEGKFEMGNEMLEVSFKVANCLYWGG